METENTNSHVGSDVLEQQYHRWCNLIASSKRVVTTTITGDNLKKIELIKIPLFDFLSISSTSVFALDAHQFYFYSTHDTEEGDANRSTKSTRIEQHVVRVGLLPPGENYVSFWQILLRNAPPKPPTHPLMVLSQLRRCCIILLDSGFFAGGFFYDGRPTDVHKAFHKISLTGNYRNKKNSNNSSGKKGNKKPSSSSNQRASSASESMKKHNEAKFQNDVRDVISSWSTHIEEADIVIIHAPGHKNRRMLFWSQQQASSCNRNRSNPNDGGGDGAPSRDHDSEEGGGGGGPLDRIDPNKVQSVPAPLVSSMVSPPLNYTLVKALFAKLMTVHIKVALCY